METRERIQFSPRTSECLIVDISRGSVTGRTSRGGRSSIEEPTGALFITPCCITQSWVVPDTHSRPGAPFALKARTTSAVEALPCLKRRHDPNDGGSRHPGRCRRMGAIGAAGRAVRPVRQPERPAPTGKARPGRFEGGRPDHVHGALPFFDAGLRGRTAGRRPRSGRDRLAAARVRTLIGIQQTPITCSLYGPNRSDRD